MEDVCDGCFGHGDTLQQQAIFSAPGQVDWDSTFFDELSDLVDAGDLLQDGKQECFDYNLDSLDMSLDLKSWSSLPWDEAYTYSAASNLKLEPLSPASSSYSVPSPLSMDSASSTQHVPEELNLCSTSKMSSFSLYVEHHKRCLSPEMPLKDETASRNIPKGNTHVKQRKLAPVVPKPTAQLKSIIVPARCDTQTFSVIAAKSMNLQPLKTLLPKHQPVVSFHTTPARGQPILLAPDAVVQLHAPRLLTAPTVFTTAAGRAEVPGHGFNVPAPTGNATTTGKAPTVPPSMQTAAQSVCSDTNLIRRQERMIKNRESAFQSRRKKKEYMQAMECRLKAALAENEKLKKENGSLQKLLKNMESENMRLKETAPKRRALCLMVVVAFVMLNFSPMSLFEKVPRTLLGSGDPVHHNRHLLGFSSGEGLNKAEKVPENIGYEYERSISNGKALMVLKEEALLYISPQPPPCQPQVNRTETRRLAQELRGWVHRHEVAQTKARRMSNHQQKTRVVQKTPEKSTEESQLLTMQYSNVKNPGSELQIYYASPRSYQDFLEALQRRGDTFYVVSFRRDHLLLPAINRNKTTRPKMSVVLPAVNINENVINGQDYEVMMQIDCEVMDTRILHIKASSIPPFLREQRENLTNTFYRPSTATPKPTGIVNVITEAAL
ncbi:cyclic AMP-dependent transcription factor ATF-6 alpha isoform X1 [Pleurodeles waltl]|uniref:cyclic AMP-dependent transcription factor ATF-6 alpha isoform X1 n=2 Tax=Pleurodeles waltl TaxID=8319 RepID=UPI003709AFA4